MKTKIKKWHCYPALVCLSLTIVSCAPAYIPHVVNSPMFKNKNEFQASLHTGSSGFDAQLSYAITDNFGIMTNGSFIDHTNDSTRKFHKHSYMEAGVGYYKKFLKTGRYEVFGGYGLGRVNYFETELFYPYTSAKYRSYFIQPAIGGFSDILDYSIATRLIVIDMYQGPVKSTGVFFEPAVTAKVGFRYVRMIFQWGYSLPLKEKFEFTHQMLFYSIGIQVNIGRMFEH
ncbi:MAG: hypothetical protein JXQ80_04730 [Bacteroidales bacterium]|nr:hypothetical protein [Bacteroidales bacterium]